MDKEGAVLSTVNRRSVEGFKDAVTKAQAYVDLVNKTDRTPAEELKLIEAQLGMGKISGDEALGRLDGVEGADEAAVTQLRAAIEAKAFDSEIETALQSAGRPTSQAEADATIAKLGASFWESYEAGKRPSSGSEIETPFYSVLMQYGINSKLAGPARAGFDKINALHGSNPQAKAQIDKFRKMVEEVEAGSK